MDKRAEFSEALKAALKSKDDVALSTVRLILAALKDRDIAARGQGKTDGISEDEILSMLASMIKQRHESAKIYQDAKREDLSEREELEIHVIQRFMPKQLNEDETDAAIAEAVKEASASSIKDIGKVMAILKTRYAGQLDMGAASGLVKAKLS